MCTVYIPRSDAARGGASDEYPGMNRKFERVSFRAGNVTIKYFFGMKFVVEGMISE